VSVTGQERPDDILRSADSAMYLAKLRERRPIDAGPEPDTGESEATTLRS
jgi:hypothetical protein